MIMLPKAAAEEQVMAVMLQGSLRIWPQHGTQAVAS
jgi:hypothetical protein